METLRIVVTGGAGFIGSHVVKRLISKGHQVLIADNLSSGSIANLRDLGVKQECFVGDLRDYEFARECTKGADVVYHFAADIGNVEYLHGSVERELAALQSNVTIDASVFRACVENKIDEIIYASSVSVYSLRAQMSNDAIFKEEDAEMFVEPEGGYGWAKYLAERQLMTTIKGIRAGIARIFHAYGENIYLQPDRSQVIGSLIRKAIRYPREDFVVWGDGRARRCFLFIDDLLDAIELLVKYVEKHGTLAVNMGSQEEVSIAELARRVITISGRKITPKYDLNRPTGVMSRKPDLSRASTILGWKPKVDLDNGLRRTYAWAEERIKKEIGVYA